MSLKGKSQQETFSLIKESGKTARITVVRDSIDDPMTSSKLDNPSVNRNPSNSLEDELEKSGVRISKR